MIRVLHLAPQVDAQSGIGRYAERFRAALEREGSIALNPLHFCSEAPLNSAADLRAYVRAALQEARAGYDLVHAECGSGALRQFYAAWAVSRFAPAAVCLTIHDPPRPVWMPFHAHAVRQRWTATVALARAADPVAQRAEHRMLSDTHAALVLTQAGIEAVEQFHPGLAGAVAAIPHVPGRAHPDAGSPGDAGADLRLGFLGYWYDGKGIETLIDALHALRRQSITPELELWGDVSQSTGTRLAEQYRRSVLTAIAHRRLGGQVHVHGFLEEADLPRALSELDAVVLPYHANRSASGTSGVIFDALAAGCPVVAANVRALHETVRHGENGLLYPAGDTCALSETLLALHRDRSLLARLRRGAEQSARRMHAAPLASPVLETYEIALSRHHVASRLVE